MQIVHTSHQDIVHKKYTSYIYNFIETFVPFLHFETHKFCTNILFHDVFMDYIKIFMILEACDEHL
jgi:hypothetical protein